MKLLLARELGKYGLASSTAYYLAKRGEIPCVKFGQRAIRFPQEAVEEWLNRKVKHPIEQPK